MDEIVGVKKAEGYSVCFYLHVMRSIPSLYDDDDESLFHKEHYNKSKS